VIVDVTASVFVMLFATVGVPVDVWATALAMLRTIDRVVVAVTASVCENVVPAGRITIVFVTLFIPLLSAVQSLGVSLPDVYARRAVTTPAVAVPAPGLVWTSLM